MTENNRTIFRIQDKDGRGPYKPGWSHVWQEYRCLIDGFKKPVMMDEFPGIVGRMGLKFGVSGGHFGCGFRSLEQLNKWFEKEEIKKLSNYGYSIVRIDADEILAESENQLVFWCKKPLKKVCKSVVLEAA